MKKLFLSLLLLLIPCMLAFAAEDFYIFKSTADQKRFQTLTTELRCLVCQNQNLAESNAGLAADLRDTIFQQINQGKSDQDIINFLVTRYGDFILYRPPVNALTAGLWFGPILFLLAGLSYLIYYVRKKPRDASV